MPDEQPQWLDPLVDELEAAAGDPDHLAEIYSRLVADLGTEEAGRRWWAAFGSSDASHT